MSRSRRKTPVIGVTTAESEKEDKKLAHRKIRAKERRGEEPEHPAEGGDVWGMAKDGKQRFDPTQHPEWMRK